MKSTQLSCELMTDALMMRQNPICSVVVLNAYLRIRSFRRPTVCTVIFRRSSPQLLTKVQLCSLIILDLSHLLIVCIKKRLFFAAEGLCQLSGTWHIVSICASLTLSSYSAIFSCSFNLVVS
jgi:hypothetical protein